MTQIKKIHFVGIGGVGTGTLAVALAKNGYEVSGSDGALYEPMKSVLASSQIEMVEGFHADTPSKTHPDIVIIGNVVRKENPEAQAWIRSNIPFISFPEAVRRFVIGDKTSVVCAGTHGKTSTTTWISYLLEKLGKKPSYLIGGVPVDLSTGSHISDGDIFVGEGDEYDSAFFDKGPKFLHYKPDLLVLSNIEFDHADIYRDFDHIRSSFRKLVSILPGDGLCIARFEDPTVMELVADSLCAVETFGLSESAMWRAEILPSDDEFLHFEVKHKRKKLGTFRTRLMGEHNICNLLSGIVVATSLGVSLRDIQEILPAFGGVKRRQQILLSTPVTLIDDFAHHPTEVRSTLNAVRHRFQKGKLWAIFEPRSATARRNIHQKEYGESFDSADEIFISRPYLAQSINESERFSADTLVSNLCSRKKIAHSFDDTQKIVEVLAKETKPQDIIVVMSNGEFDKIQDKLLRALKEGK